MAGPVLFFTLVAIGLVCLGGPLAAFIIACFVYGMVDQLIEDHYYEKIRERQDNEVIPWWNKNYEIHKKRMKIISGKYGLGWGKHSQEIWDKAVKEADELCGKTDPNWCCIEKDWFKIAREEAKDKKIWPSLLALIVILVSSALIYFIGEWLGIFSYEPYTLY